MESQTQNTPGITTRAAGVRYGLIGAVISIVYFIVLNVAGIDMTSGVWNWVGYGITLVIVFLAHKYYKDSGDGFMTYGQGVGIAFWIGLCSAVIASVFNYFYMKFIDSGFIEMVKQRQIEAMQSKGLTNEQIDQSMKMASAFMTPEMMFIFSLLGALVITVIIGLIVSIFTQKSNPQPAF